MKLKAKIRQAAQRMRVDAIHDRIYILSGQISEVEADLRRLESMRERERTRLIAAESLLASLKKDL